MVLSVRAISHAYGELEAIERLDLELPAHGVLGLVGPSGCGKSTLLELIAGLRQPSAGEIEVGGGDAPAERLARCAFMPQRDLLLPWLSAIDNAALALRNRGERRGAAREQAGDLFERFGLGAFEPARPARVVEELGAPSPRAADRDAAVTDPEFVAARERAMEALHGGSR